jgi:biopolymer transport protein ExbB
MFSLIQLQADSIAGATTNAVIEKIATNSEISVLEFILKGGFFLIPISILLFYTFYLIIERYLFVQKASIIDPLMMRDIRNSLKSGKLDNALEVVERNSTSSANVLKEGILLIGRPISEIESNMDRAADIEIGEMEKHLGQLGLIAGIAPTLGFIGTISGVIKIFYSISVTENISIGNISGGLYEKMISSGAGLVVGIIAYSGYHLLNGKIDNFALKIQKQILEFVNIIQKA